MKVYCEAWVNDEAEEYLINLTTQGYFAEAYEFKMRLMIAFEHSLDFIIGNVLNEELKARLQEQSK